MFQFKPQRQRLFPLLVGADLITDPLSPGKQFLHQGRFLPNRHHHAAENFFVNAGNPEKNGRPFGTDILGDSIDTFGVGFGNALEHQVKMHRHPFEDVTQGQKADADIAIVTVRRSDGIKIAELGHDRTMGMHGPLGNAGGTRGILDGQQIVGADYLGQLPEKPRLLVVAPAPQGLQRAKIEHPEMASGRSLAADQNQILQLRALVCRLQGFVELGQVLDNQGPGAAVIDNKSHLCSRHRGIDGNHGGADAQPPEIGIDPLKAVFGKNADAVATAKTQLVKAQARSPGALVILIPGRTFPNAVAPFFDRQPITVLLHPIIKNLINGGFHCLSPDLLFNFPAADQSPGPVDRAVFTALIDNPVIGHNDAAFFVLDL